MKTLLKLLLIPIIPLVGLLTWVYTFNSAEKSGVRMLTTEGLKAAASGDFQSARRFLGTAGQFMPMGRPRATKPPAAPPPPAALSLPPIFGVPPIAGNPAVPAARPSQAPEAPSEKDKALAEGNFIWSQHWLMSGDVRRALQLVNDGLKLDPSNDNLHRALEEIQRSMGKAPR